MALEPRRPRGSDFSNITSSSCIVFHSRVCARVRVCVRLCLVSIRCCVVCACMRVSVCACVCARTCIMRVYSCVFSAPSVHQSCTERTNRRRLAPMHSSRYGRYMCAHTRTLRVYLASSQCMCVCCKSRHMPTHAFCTISAHVYSIYRV